MRTRRFRVVSLVLLLLVSLSLSASTLAVEPVADETTQEGWANSWSPVQFFLQVWKSVVGGGVTAPATTDENGLTQATEEAPDHGPLIEPNGRSL